MSDRRQLDDAEREVLRLVIGRLAALTEDERDRQIGRLFEVASMPDDEWHVIRNIPRSKQFWLGVVASISAFGALVGWLLSLIGIDGFDSAARAAKDVLHQGGH